MPDMTDPYQWQGRTMFSADGERIGKISDVYEDPATGRPEWATVSTGLFGTRSNFVPLAGATPAGDDVRAPVTKDQVTGAPEVENDDAVSEQEERRLIDHYGVPAAVEGSTVTPDKRDAGRTRLRRYVVTDRLVMEVPARRHEVNDALEPSTEARGRDPLHGSGVSGEEPWGTEDTNREGRGR